ncbi:RES family NAD+ phosphorylase [Marinobacter sp. VGCF2001]|uniref:RES family NAD+ phosphorylase n=1 Tax=Marinobacter sp. VGCF2001 TaxID=3417189 RepID=UPI003CF3F133
MRPAPPLVLPEWKAHRIIPSHYPPIDLFERIYDTPEELAIAFEIEAMTNDRLLDEAGDLQLIPPDDRLFGPGSSPVMAAFTHLGFGSRFTNGDFGVYYAADSLETAIAETIYHKEREMAAAGEESIELTMRCYVGEIARAMQDIREEAFADLHNPDDYSASQAYAASSRANGSDGLLYNSVRRPGHECIAAFRPVALHAPVQGEHLKYFWDGKKRRITHWAKISDAHEVPL